MRSPITLVPCEHSMMLLWKLQIQIFYSGLVLRMWYAAWFIPSECKPLWTELRKKYLLYSCSKFEGVFTSKLKFYRKHQSWAYHWHSWPGKWQKLWMFLRCLVIYSNLMWSDHQACHVYDFPCHNHKLTSSTWRRQWSRTFENVALDHGRSSQKLEMC